MYLLVAPLIVPFTFGDEAAYPGDSNAVNCMVMKGDLPLDIHWTFNGRLLRNGERGVTILRMKPRLSSLSIDALDGGHRGWFGCVASNAAGVSNLTAELLINGAQEMLSYVLVRCAFFYIIPGCTLDIPKSYTGFCRAMPNM